MDGLARLDVLAEHLDDGSRLVFSLGNQFVNSAFEVDQGFSHGTVQGYHCAGTVGLRAHGAEFKSVTREGKRTCSVAVGIVDEQFRNLRNVQLHLLFAGNGEEVVLVSLFDMLQ